MADVKRIFYYGLIVLSCVIAAWLSYINLEEAIRRVMGVHTVFSQLSWLTDGQAAIYCAFLALSFALLMGLSFFWFRHKNRKAAVIGIVVIWGLAIGSFLLERFFFNNRIV